MAYHQDTPAVLAWQYPDLIPGVGEDYWLEAVGNEWNLTWTTAAHPQPSEQDVLDWRLPYWKKVKRVEWRKWADLLAMRAFEDGEMGSGTDNLITDLSQAFRSMINDAGISGVNITNADRKSAIDTRPRLKVIRLGGEARSLGKTDVNTQTDPEVLKAYVVDDAKAAALWSADNGGSTDLEDLLGDHPTDYE